jgi:23S rRNA (adenine2030-N6)-methyltransferase
MVAAGMTRVVRLELAVDRLSDDGPLCATGLVVANPPYVLIKEAQRLLPYLTRVLSRGEGASFTVEALTSL